MMYICNALKLIFLWNPSQYKKRLMTIIKTCVPAEIMTAAKKRSRAEVQSNYIHNCQTEGSSVSGVVLSSASSVSQSVFTITEKALVKTGCGTDGSICGTLRLRLTFF